MCGIVGFAGNWPSEVLTELCDSLFYRGPDEAGEYYDPQTGVGLAMRRLSILDLAGGHQPMGNEDNSIRIVFNGEIYNAPQLRSRLISQGHRFKTAHSDTECLLHLYEEKGPGMLGQLNGMFAFVIYDQKRRCLFGARDRIGIKPFYYTRQPGGFAFASELKTLLLLPSISRDINLQSLYHYLSLRYIPGPESIFQGIFRLRPAHYCIYDLDRRTLTLERYWHPFPRRQEKHSVDEWGEILYDEVKSAVQRWSLSDVPIACSLSGGIDSASIVGLLSETSNSRIRTYTLGFRGEGEEDLNELPLARKVAQKWGTDHHELYLTPDVLLHDLVKMVWHLDEPYGGGLPSWYIFQFMSQDVKVGLTGTGGDELFGNYGKWRWFEQPFPFILNPFAQKLHYTIRRIARKLPESLIGKTRKAQIAKELYTLAHPMDSYPFICIYDHEKVRYLHEMSGKGFLRTMDWLQGRYNESETRDIRNGIAYVDMQTQLPEEYLLMTDRFSMAFSLEARVPFLDHLLVECVLSIPPGIRTRLSDVKYLLKKAIGHLLPPEYLTAKKQGFIIPENLWLRGKLRPLVERLLSPPYLEKQGIFDSNLYHTVVSPYLDGSAPKNSDRIWTLLMFQLWYTVFIDAAATDSPAFAWHDLL